MNRLTRLPRLLVCAALHTPAVPATSVSPIFPSPHLLFFLYAGLHAAEEATIKAGLVQIRRLSTLSDAVPAIVAAGALPRVTELMTHPSVDIQIEAVWVLTNCTATESNECTSAVVQAGAVPHVVRGMASPNPAMREQCIWCVGNIAGDSPALRDMLAMTPDVLTNVFLNIRHPEQLSILQQCAWTLLNFTRGQPALPDAYLTEIVRALIFLMTSDDKSIQFDAAWGLGYATENPAGAAAILESGQLPLLLAVLAPKGGDELGPGTMGLLRTVGNMVALSESYTRAILDAGAVRVMVGLMKTKGKNVSKVRREACWTLSNVAAGKPSDIDCILTTPGAVSALLDCAAQRGNSAAGERREALWALVNMVNGGTLAHKAELVSGGVLSTIFHAFKTFPDKRVQVVLLEALEALLNASSALSTALPGRNIVAELEEQGLPPLLEEVQELADDDDLVDAAARILLAHYGGEYVEVEGEEAGAAPSSPAAAPAVFPSFSLAGATDQENALPPWAARGKAAAGPLPMGTPGSSGKTHIPAARGGPAAYAVPAPVFA